MVYATLHMVLVNTVEGVEAINWQQNLTKKAKTKVNVSVINDKSPLSVFSFGHNVIILSCQQVLTLTQKLVHVINNGR